MFLHKENSLPIPQPSSREKRVGHFLELVQKFLCASFRVDLITHQMTSSKAQRLLLLRFFFCLLLLTADLSSWLQGDYSSSSIACRHSNILLRGEFPFIHLLLLLRKIPKSTPSRLSLRSKDWVTYLYLNYSLSGE